jgi:hypothetical protein
LQLWAEKGDFSAEKPPFHLRTSELVNVCGAQESIPKNQFRQPMLPGGPVRQRGLSDRRPARAGNRFLVALKGLQIRALVIRRLYVNYIKDEGLSYFIFKSSCPPFFTIRKAKLWGKKVSFTP